MLILKIKQAEKALADGRLDEAFELLTSSVVTSHRQGQELITKLATALAVRGREHLDKNRPGQARADAEKAQKLAGNLPEVAGLLADITAMYKDNWQAEHARQKQRNLVKGFVDEGELTLAAGVLDDEPNSGTLRDEIEKQRKIRQSWERRLEMAFAESDLDRALDVLGAFTPGRFNGTARKVVELAEKQGHEYARSGRLDRLEVLLVRLAELKLDSTKIRDLTRFQGLCHTASKQLGDGLLSETRATLSLARQLMPQADWINDTLKAARQAEESLTALHGGALALLDGAATEIRDATEPRHKKTDKPIMPIDMPANNMLPEKFILQLDGVGSFLVYRSADVSAGPLSGSFGADLALVAAPDLTPVRFVRSEDDYFLKATEPVELNGRKVDEALLKDNDRVSLSSRCVLKFKRANAASGTAVLDLGSVRVTRPDVRQVILMDREIVIGPASTAHLRSRLPESITIFIQNNRLGVKTAGSTIKEVVLNQPLNLSGTTLVVREIKD